MIPASKNYSDHLTVKINRKEPMPNHLITLNYDSTKTPNFKPDVDPVRVKKGDTISFTRGIAPPNTKFKITMEKGFFSVEEVEFTTGTPPIGVGDASEKPTTYHCQLINTNTNAVLDETKGRPGGGVEPDKGKN
jgi:hypothetical protein